MNSNWKNLCLSAFLTVSISCSLLTVSDLSKEAAQPVWLFEGWSCAPLPWLPALSPVFHCNHDDPNPEYYYVLTDLRLETSFDEPYDLIQRCESQIESDLKEERVINSIVIESYSITDSYLSSYNNPIRNFSDRGLIACCPLDSRTGRCLNSYKRKHDSCICGVFAQYPGGRQRFENEFFRINEPYISRAP